ncbi:unnamed protein product [Discosporangium mesarthrocarpum]
MDPSKNPRSPSSWSSSELLRWFEERESTENRERMDEILYLQAKLAQRERVAEPSGGPAATANVEAKGEDKPPSKHISSSAWTIPCVSVNSQGLSYFGEKEVPMGAPAEIGTLSQLIGGTGVIFRETPGEYDFDFHVAPTRQFVVSLDAGVDIEVSNGTRRVFPAGTVMFLEDTWGQGHRSRAVGGMPRRSLFIPILDDSVMV